MQAADKGLKKVVQELVASENDGAISLGFRKVSYMWIDVHSFLLIFVNSSQADDKIHKILVAVLNEMTSFFQVLKEFLDIAEAEVRLLASLYKESVSYTII